MIPTQLRCQRDARFVSVDRLAWDVSDRTGGIRKPELLATKATKPGWNGWATFSELVALDVEDLRFSPSGLYVWIAAAKNDPRKAGRELYVPRLPASGPKAELCAVTALEHWLETVGPTGPLFRSFDLRGQLTEKRLWPTDVARILRRRCAAAGVVGDFAGHSLRRGFITNATKKKIPIESIKRVTGQRSSGIVLGYVATATIDEDPPLLEIVG